MESFKESIAKLDAELNSILDRVKISVASTANEAYQLSTESLEEANSESGLHTRAERTKKRLELALVQNAQFNQQFEQLQQIFLISEDLKDAIRKLEKTYK